VRRVLFALLLVGCTSAAAPTPTPTPTPTHTPTSDPPGIECAYPLHGTPRLPYGIMFEKDSDVLDAVGEKAVAEIVTARQLQGARPTIVRFAAIGYAEADEPNPADLSRRRAQRVIDALAQHGIAVERMEAHGLGTARARNAERTTLPNRYVAFETLYEYRGGASYWAGDHLEACPSEGRAPTEGRAPIAACAPPSYYAGFCHGRPAW
jgi:outer membrane protein OmpA-like peptidoglycan-associated protein